MIVHIPTNVSFYSYVTPAICAESHPNLWREHKTASCVRIEVDFKPSAANVSERAKAPGLTHIVAAYVLQTTVYPQTLKALKLSTGKDDCSEATIQPICITPVLICNAAGLKSEKRPDGIPLVPKHVGAQPSLD